jgi:hypothetical protein
LENLARVKHPSLILTFGNYGLHECSKLECLGLTSLSVKRLSGDDKRYRLFYSWHDDRRFQSEACTIKLFTAVIYGFS